MFHTGTSADIMKVGGYKLSALEIESALLEVISFHPPF
jgi:acyl-coenzyme A synthetase/AMP-(fatty) acid ligase